MKVAATLPVEPGLAPAVIVAVVPPTLIVRAALGMKLLPLIVTDVPTGPLVGWGRRERRRVTVNCVPDGDRVRAVRDRHACCRAPAVGIVNVAATATGPLALAPAVIIAVGRPTLIVRAALGMKLLPLIVTPDVPPGRSSGSAARRRRRHRELRRRDPCSCRRRRSRL